MFELQIAIASIALESQSPKREKGERRPCYFQSEKSDLGMSHKRAIKQERSPFMQNCHRG